MRQMIKKYGNKIYDYLKPEKEIITLVNLLKNLNIKKILDLGCGEGRHFRYLTDLGFDVYGIDIDEETIIKAKEKSPDVKNKLITGYMQCLPYSDNYFDAIISNQVIYHATRQGMQKTISEIYRILKNQGIFFITLQSRDGQEWRFGKKLESWTYIASEGLDKGTIHHYVDLEEINELFGKNNLLKVYLDERNDWCVLGKIVK